MTAVLYEVRDRIARIRLNRPDRLNAISQGLVAGLNDALGQALTSDETDVILLAAEGRAFCSGDDLAEFSSHQLDRDQAHAAVEALQDVTRKIMLGAKPVVCAAQGWIVGGGAAWPLNADFVVLSTDAAMFCPEARYGLFPTGGASILLAELCGQHTANRILMLGERVRADELASQGLCRAPVPVEGLFEAALEVAQEIAKLPAESRQSYKAARQAGIGERLERALTIEAQRCVEAVTSLDVRARIASAGFG